jgi:hypothetical protein
MGVIGDYYTYVEGKLGTNGSENVYETKYGFKNYCQYIEQGFLYNLFGLAVAAIGVFVLRSQGVIVNAVDKLIDDKKLVEAEEEYLKNLGNDDSNAYSTLTRTKEPKEEIEDNSCGSEEN